MSKLDSKGEGTTSGWKVQARCTSTIMSQGQPRYGPRFIGHKWTTLYFEKVAHGVKNAMWDEVAEKHGILTYPAAKALLATVAAENSWHYDVELRLVKYKCVTTYEITVEGYAAIERFGFLDEDALELEDAKEDVIS